MKVLFVSTTGGPINAFLIPHIELLIKDGHQVDIVCNVIRELSPEFLRLGCKVHNIEFSRSPFNKNNIKVIKEIKRLVLLEKYDLIHTHTPIASFVTRFACRKIPNLKMLYTAHGFHFFKGASLKNRIIYKTMEKIAARWTDGIITMNGEDYISAKQMKLRQNGSVFKVHGVGVNLKKFVNQKDEEKNILREKYNYNKKDFILIYAAELSNRKHQDLLIDSIHILRNRIPNIKLLLAGEGPLSKQYSEQVRRLELNKNVYFLGFRKDVVNLMLLSDIAVSSSRQEGLPVNIMEAMATGLPLVVTNCRGNIDLVKNGENGFIVPLDDINAFVEAIEKLYSSEKLRKKCSENSIKKVQKYSLDEVLDEMYKVYSTFIS
jgi:glycosyltransferase EpsD